MSHVPNVTQFSCQSQIAPLGSVCLTMIPANVTTIHFEELKGILPSVVAYDHQHQNEPESPDWWKYHSESFSYYPPRAWMITVVYVLCLPAGIDKLASSHVWLAGPGFSGTCTMSQTHLGMPDTMSEIGARCWQVSKLLISWVKVASTENLRWLCADCWKCFIAVFIQNEITPWLELRNVGAIPVRIDSLDASACTTTALVYLLFHTVDRQPSKAEHLEPKKSEMATCHSLF